MRSTCHDCISPSAFWIPKHVTAAPAWLEHAPFSFWLIEALSPRTLVELGTHSGYSYFSFCQAVQELNLGTRCYAVDTWKGDVHSGFYGEDIFQEVRSYNEQQYSAFSMLIRSSFDQALDQFDDGSIDLLHIDGCHFYQDVKHDFETWRPKLSDRGVILFHDTNVRNLDFGVFKLWQELAGEYQHFEFVHGHGLGVLGIGQEVSPPLRTLFDASKDMRMASEIRDMYSRLGSIISLQAAAQKANVELRRRTAEVAAARKDSAEARDNAYQNKIALDSVLHSRSWRYSAPLRKMRTRYRQARQLIGDGLSLRWPPITRPRNNGLAKVTYAAAAQDIPQDPTGYTPEIGILPWFNPLNVRVAAALANRPTLNVILPGLAMKHMSGGPNTAVNIACRLAARGVPVRLVSADAPVDSDASNFWNHVHALADAEQKLSNVELVDASNRQTPFIIGANDVFMATAWWTAQMTKYAIRHTRHDRFIYLIQDYELLLHPASTEQALAKETYTLDYIPVVNTQLLCEFLSSRKIGRFSDPDFASRAIVFEPAIDTTLFFPRGRRKLGDKRRLLFYTRPTIGRRNLFEMGVAALRKLVVEGHIEPDDWQFIGIGEEFGRVSLGRGAYLEPSPWLDLESYADLMQDSDVLLSLMLSPHPSYPPLEMAACGHPVVTTVYGNKTAERLAEISSSIIGVEPTIEAIAEGLLRAMQRHSTQAVQPPAMGFPASWAESLSETVPRLFEEMIDLIGAPRLPANSQDTSVSPGTAHFPGYRHWPTDRYNVLRLEYLSERREAYRNADPTLISFVTTLWNTNPDYVAALAECVFGQDSGTEFEWIILDNGTTAEKTREILQSLARHPAVRLFRVEQNIGISRGLRYCLERAKNRYIIPLDSDDLLTPDCVRILTSALKAANFPALAYSDEDKVLDDHFRDPYFKPDWDPVLFVHSCYIAHICAIDRELALRLDAYTDQETEGSHDGDTFMRFHLAGYTPFHIPETLYTWRMHPLSAAANIHSKDYILSSQIKVLNRFISSTPHPNHFRVEPSPLFNGTPDWRIVRSRTAPLPITTFLICDGPKLSNMKPQFSGHRIEILDKHNLGELLDRTKACATEKRLVHLLADGARVDDRSWASEGMALMELFPDAVMVGGRIHCRGIVLGADAYFGFGDGCDSPNIGRSLNDVGYFAQMWKPHSASAVPVEHCLIELGFLANALQQLAGTGVTFDYLSAWLGAIARERDRRVIYSPFFSARVNGPLAGADTQEKAAFIAAHSSLIPERALFSRHLGLTLETAYSPLTRSERQAQEVRHLSQSPEGWQPCQAILRT